MGWNFEVVGMFVTCRIKATLMGREGVLLLLDKRQCRTKPLIFNDGG